MKYAQKVLLHCPNGYQAYLDALVKDFLRDGVLYIGVVGVDCTLVEDIIDELLVGDGSGEPRFILTASHPGESISDAIALSKLLTGEYAGEEVQVVELWTLTGLMILATGYPFVQERPMQEPDDKFFDRADAHIHLSNDQISGEVTKGKVSASMMYATARFNSWVSASGWTNPEEMEAAKEETIEYFVQEYRKMLDENLNDYIQNFTSYMGGDNA